MKGEAVTLMIEDLAEDMSDADEYPAMMARYARCVVDHLISVGCSEGGDGDWVCDDGGFGDDPFRWVGDEAEVAGEAR